VRDQLGGKPWGKQEEILAAVRDHSRVAVRSCNGSGKTYIAAYAVLWWLMCFDDALVITTAPTAHQVRDVLWREIRRAYRGNESLIDGKLFRTTLELADKHYANGLSTNTPERFQGFHEGHIMFVVDEASGVRESIFEAIEGSMTSEHARMLLLGNPTSLSGTFYEAFHRRRKLWKTIHISAFDTPNLVAGEVLLPYLVTPQWVADAEANWGTESGQYQVRVLGEFPSEAEDSLISLKWIEAAMERWETGAAGEPAVPVEIGVDVARFGSDSTVICVRAGDRVIELTATRREDITETAGRVVDAARRHNPQVVRVDEIGIGAGVVDVLRERGTRGVVGVNVARRAKDSERFANLRAELYDGLKQRFREGRIAIPDDQDLVSELAALKYSFTSSGQTKLQDKDELRSAVGRSTDRADALMLAFAALARPSIKVWV
jgi:hypothetical protein